VRLVIGELPEKIKVGVYSSRLNFIKKELAVSYNYRCNKKEIVGFDNLGYEPS
jgi:hypothetical protein